MHTSLLGLEIRLARRAATRSMPASRAGLCAAAVPRGVQELSVQETAEQLSLLPPGEAQLLDVREQWEHALSSLPGWRLTPMSAPDDWVSSLDATKPTYVLCHHGVRSRHVADWLVAQGAVTAPVYNVSGGIDAWSRHDKSVPRY